MARPTTTEKIGEGACLSCGKSVFYRKTSGGNLKLECQHCDLSAYCPPGSTAHAKALASIASNAEPTEKPGSVREPEKAPPPPAAKKAHFDLGSL